MEDLKVGINKSTAKTMTTSPAIIIPGNIEIKITVVKMTITFYEE